MAKLINQDGTNQADELIYDQNGSNAVYHTGAGKDTVTIAGEAITVINDSGAATITIKGGKDHEITGVGTSIEVLTINGANSVNALLGSGKDTVTLQSSNGRKSSGALSAIRGGDWGDTFTVGTGVSAYQLYGEAGNDTFNINGGSGINFWGGAANDTFIVKGGTDNKLYGGDSADLFEIYTARQNMILGYGNDTVNIYSGANSTIKANLGINQINLMAGTGHIIESDIDQAASKKAGKDVGYGVDKVLITGKASAIIANLGDGKDEVVIESGSNHKIYTEGWGDTVTINGSTIRTSTIDLGDGDDVLNLMAGSSNTIVGGEGVDTFNISGGSQNKLEGGAGADKYFVTGGSANDISAGEGKDSLVVEAGGIRYADMGQGDASVEVKGGSVQKVTLGDATNQVKVSGGLVSTVAGGAGADTLEITGGKVSGATLGLGDDHVIVNGAEAEITTVDVGGGNNIVDLIAGNAAKITFGNGNNTLNMMGVDNYSAKLGSGNDIINVTKGQELVLDGANGNDTFTVEDGNTLTLTGGYGLDIFQINGGTDVTANGDDGNDSFTITAGLQIKADGGNGDDTFVTEDGEDLTLTGGMGVDTFNIKGGAKVKALGGEGNDSYTVEKADGVTITDDAGNDTVLIKDGLEIVANTGAGVDTLTVEGGSNVKLYAEAGMDIITVKGGKDILVDGGADLDKFTISGGEKITAVGGTGDDQFEITGGSDITINDASGSNIYKISNAEKVTINGSSSVDTITITSGTDIKADTGAGADKITIKGGDQVYVKGGAGSDTYAVEGLQAQGQYTLDLTGGATYDADVLDFSKFSKSDFDISLEGEDVILVGKNDSQVTIKGWKVATNTSIKFSDSDALFQAPENRPKPTTNATSQVELMQNLMAALSNSNKTGVEALNEAVKTVAMGRFANFEALVKEYTDLIKRTNNVYINDREDFLAEYCDMYTNNKDNGALLGSDCGGTIDMRGNNVVPGVSDKTMEDYVYDNSRKLIAYDTVSKNEKLFYGKTVNGLTFYWDESSWNNLINNKKVAREMLEQTVAGITNIWAEGAMKLVEDSYGLSLTNQYSKLQQLEDGSRGIQLKFIYDDTKVIYDYSNRPVEISYVQNAETGVVNEALTINMAFMTKPFETVYGIVKNSVSMDRALAHEFVHGAMAANMLDPDKMPSFVKEGLAEWVHGQEDYNGQVQYPVSYEYGFVESGCNQNYRRAGFIDLLYDIHKTTYTAMDTLSGGYILLRYFAKQVMDAATGMSSSMVVGSGEMVDICINPDITFDPTKNLVAGSK